MKYFGHHYRAPAYDECERVEVPVGKPCAHCEEPIEVGDDGWVVPALNAREIPFHRACQLRMILGSVAHQQRRCSCFVSGSQCGDDSGLTRRQAAEAALEYYIHGR